MYEWLAILIAVIVLIVLLLLPTEWTYKLIGAIVVIVLAIIAFVLIRNMAKNQPLLGSRN